jgi:hypothetical protein
LPTNSSVSFLFPFHQQRHRQQLLFFCLLINVSFAGSDFSVVLNVKKHSDVGVLIAVVDVAVFTVVVSEEGRCMTKVALHVRNTQRQFVRISIPVKFDIWSAAMAGAPVKPAMDENGLVMVPLQKSSAKEEGADRQTTFAVELVYVSVIPPLSNEGDLHLKFPYCDIPINQLLVEVYLPSNFSFQTFTGLREVKIGSFLFFFVCYLD